MTWLLRWTLNGDFSLILLQLVKEQLTHDVGHWALLQGMKRQFSLAKVKRLDLGNPSWVAGPGAFPFKLLLFLWPNVAARVHPWQNISLLASPGWLVGWARGIPASDWSLPPPPWCHRDSASNPSSKCQNVYNQATCVWSLLLIIICCFPIIEVSLQGGRVWLKDPDAVWKPAEVRFDLFSKISQKSQRYLIKGCDRLQWKEPGGGGWKWRQSDNLSEGCQEWTSRPATSKVNLQF